MKTITDILDWKLLSGSHLWPGPHGGTCINEAAIVVAGLPYKSVSSPKDLPPCFSKVIGAYLIGLNDNMADGPRQRLIEFAPLLSGSADTAVMERLRLEYIVMETVRRIVSMAMDTAGLSDHAAACREVKTLDESIRVSVCAAKEAKAAAFAANTDGAFKAAHAAVCASNGAAFAAYAAAYAAKAAAYVSDTAINDHCLDIVRGALAIGDRAQPIETGLIIKRVSEIRRAEKV